MEQEILVISLIGWLCAGFFWRGQERMRDRCNDMEKRLRRAILGWEKAKRRADWAESMLRVYRQASPMPDHLAPKGSWREVLEIRGSGRVSAKEINGQYRKLAKERHPDHGGSVAAMAALNLARQAGLKEVRE